MYDFSQDEYILKRDSIMYFSSDDEKCYQNHPSEYQLCDNSDNEYFEIAKTSVKPMPYKPARLSYTYRSNDTSRKLSDGNYFYNYDMDLEQLIKSAENMHSWNVDELMQYNYIAENIHKSRDKHYKKYQSSRIKNNPTERRSFTSMPKPMPKPMLNTMLPRPKWIPNGKIKNSNTAIYRSSSSFNTRNPMHRSTSCMNKTSDKSSQSKLNWKPAGAARPQSALYNRSSSDLRKSEEPVVKKLPFQDPKDVGNGWRPTLKIDRDEKIYFTYEDVNPPAENEKVTIKKFEDPKDVGNGWKPIYKNTNNNKSTENLNFYLKTDPGYVRNTVSSESTHKIESGTKTAAKSLDVGNGWKPTYTVKKKNIKFRMFTKPPVPKPSLENKRESDIKKEPSKKWAPATSKLKAVHPNTWMPENKSEASKTTVNAKLSKLTKYKQRISMLTSTPNMSMDMENRPSGGAINESIIRNEKEAIEHETRSCKNGSVQRGSMNQTPIEKSLENPPDSEPIKISASKNGSIRKISMNQTPVKKSMENPIDSDPINNSASNNGSVEKSLNGSLPGSQRRRSKTSGNSSKNGSLQERSVNGSAIENQEASKQNSLGNDSVHSLKAKEDEGDLNERISDSILEKSEEILKEQSIVKENSGS